MATGSPPDPASNQFGGGSGARRDTGSLKSGVVAAASWAQETAVRGTGAGDIDLFETESTTAAGSVGTAAVGVGLPDTASPRGHALQRRGSPVTSTQVSDGDGSFLDSTVRADDILAPPTPPGEYINSPISDRQRLLPQPALIGSSAPEFGGGASSSSRDRTRSEAGKASSVSDYLQETRLKLKMWWKKVKSAVIYATRQLRVLFSENPSVCLIVFAFLSLLAIISTVCTNLFRSAITTPGVVCVYSVAFAGFVRLVIRTLVFPGSSVFWRKKMEGGYRVLSEKVWSA